MKTQISSKIVWHPRLHELFDENLSFIGISVFLWRYFADAIDGIVEKAFEGVRPSRTVYITYGQQDILIRLYSTPERRKKLLDAISEALHFGGGEVTHFDVDNIHYIWGYEVRPEDEKPVITAMEEIDPLQLKSAQEKWEQMPETLRKKMTEERIVLGTFQRPAGKIRGLTSISLRNPSISLIKFIVGRLIERFKKEKLLHSREVIGLYEGIGIGLGFGQILVELNADKYETIWRVSELIQETLGSERAKVTTHLAANPPSEQGEGCAFGPRSTESIDKIWTAEFPALASFSAREKLSVLDLCEDWRVWLRDKKDQYARSFIESKIKGETSALTDVIGGLSREVENALRKYVTQEAKRKFKEKWKGELEKMFKRGRSFDKWGMGDLVEFVAFWSKGYKELLSEEQMRSLRDFVYLRNMFVHGRFKEELSEEDLWRKCQEVLSAVFVAYYTRLVR